MIDCHTIIDRRKVNLLDLKTANDVLTVAKAAGVPVKELVTNTLDKPTKELGEGLGSLFWLVFSPIHAARAKFEPKIESYKNQIVEEIKRIPEDKLVEAPLNISGPALEASKYYIEDDSIRTMFAKLIAASMNLETNTNSHPSFVDIIKQLSPFDAKVCQLLYLNQNNYAIADIYCDYVLEDNTTRTSIALEKFIPFEEINWNNLRDYQASVDNLVRLGLIVFSSTEAFIEQDRYLSLKQHGIYRHYQDNKELILMNDMHKITKVYTKDYAWQFTKFGSNFAACCF